MSEWKPTVHRVEKDDGEQLKAIRALVKEQRFDDARRELQSILDRQPNTLSATLGMGYVLSRQGKHREALDWSIKSSKLDPQNARPHLLAGQLHLQLEDADSAVASFDAAISIDPGSEKAFLGKGQALLQQKRLKEATENLRAALRIEPQQTQAHLLLSKIYREIGDHVSAVRELEAAVETTDDRSRIYLRLAGLYLDQGQGRNAAEAFRNAIAENPSDPSPHVMLGQYFQEKKEFRHARAEYLRAVELRPEMTPARVHLIEVLVELEEFEEALAQLGQLRRRRRFMPLVHKLKADILRRSGKARDALEEYRAALLKLPDTEQLVAEIDERLSDAENPDWTRLAETYHASVTDLVLKAIGKQRDRQDTPGGSTDR